MSELPRLRGAYDIVSWANELHRFLENKFSAVKTSGEPILLQHRQDTLQARSGVDGLVMWDVTTGLPIYSKDGAWVTMPISAFQLAEQVIKATYSHVVSVATTATVIKETDNDATLTAGSGKTTLGTFTVSASEYALLGSMLFTTTDGATTFVVEVSTGGGGYTVLTPDTIINGAGSIQLTFPEYLIVVPDTTVRVSATSTAGTAATATYLILGNKATIS